MSAGMNVAPLQYAWYITTLAASVEEFYAGGWKREEAKS